MHVSEFQKQFGNTAQDYVNHADQLHTDWYHKNIIGAAQTLVNQNRGDWEYITQYASGNSTWHGHTLDNYDIIRPQRETDQ